MKIFTIIVFGYAVIMAFKKLFQKEVIDFRKDNQYKDVIFITRVVMAVSTIWAYIWFLDVIWEYETVH